MNRPPTRRRLIENIRRRARKLCRHGILPKVACAWCGSKKNLDLHHKDYANPYLVTVLCKRCHMRHHKHNLILPEYIFTDYTHDRDYYLAVHTKRGTLISAAVVDEQCLRLPLTYGKED